MILVGQYDSPFVRRVAIALRLYGMPYEHRPWSVWADADELARLNPLMRVPTLVLDAGTVLVESAAILDAVDDLAGEDRALLPRSGSVRRDGLRVCAFAMGAADKAVSLFYEPLLRTAPSEKWMSRCRAQIEGTLDVLEDDRAARPGPWWLGERLSHPDVAVACMLRFVREALPALYRDARWPRLDAHAARAEALDEFRAIVQPLRVTGV